MILVRVTEDLIQGIVRVAKATAENDLSEEQRQKFGFLRPYSASQYVTFARQADHFYSLLDENGPVAFLLAHSIEKFDLTNEEVYSYIKSTQNEPFLVARQLAVLPEYARKGCGRALYGHLRQLASAGSIKEKAAVGFIWKQPHHNRVSEEFNRKMGGREVARYALKDGGGLVGIWAIPLTN